MKRQGYALALAVVLTVTSAGLATASPPSSCAYKFVGTWIVRVLSTGQTYPVVNLPSGVAHGSCPMCTPTGTWTCSGNTYTWSVNGITETDPLSADGRTVTGRCCIATRAGPAPKLATSSAPPSGQPDSKPEPQKKPSKAAAAPQDVASRADPRRQSASCSDITGLGGSGPSNCKPSTGVPPNLQAQINQARASMQAARTVRESDPSRAGQTAAASQYRNAAAAFGLAGDLAQERVALDEAKSIETALNAPASPTDVQSATAAPANGQSQNSCPPLAPAKNWQGTPNENYCANANCVDRGSAYYGYMCFWPSSGSTDKGAATPANHKEPRRFKRTAPDVRGEVIGLADTIMNEPDGAPDRPMRLRKFKRLLADHGVPVKPQDIACLQPVSGTSPRLADIPLRWHPYHIKKEAIDQSGLCDGVPEGDAKDACRDDKYGQAVMWAEPEIAGQCRTGNAPNFDPDAIAACAKRTFLNAWATNDGIVPAPIPDNWIMPAWCDPKTSPERRKSALVDALRKALGQGASQADNDEPGTAAADQAPVAAADPSPPVPAPADDDEAYCNYMAREVVRGELTPSPATAIPPGCRATIAAALDLKAKQQGKQFSMSADETDREVAKLMASPTSSGPQTGGKPDPKVDRQIGAK
jgi:hypothetical protein